MKSQLKINQQARQPLWLYAGLFLILAACGAQPPANATETASPSSTAVAPSTETPAPTATALIPPRTDLEAYIVQDGDSISGIAARFGLMPETVLWANRDELGDYPDYLLTGMELIILPVDGVYHQIGGADTLTNIATFFGANVEDIVGWPTNNLETSEDLLFAGNWLLVPGGRRTIAFQVMPDVSWEAAALDQAEYGRGACQDNFSSNLRAAGDYAWPVSAHQVLGDPFAEWHSGVDLPLEPGEAVLAADDGVVTFAGWSNLGYGYMVMLDHGNGDYTLYGGMGAVEVVCGQELAQGQALGAGGLTGHPAGALLHFEVRQGGELVDPLTLLPED
jgi:hypothetical protein